MSSNLMWKPANNYQGEFSNEFKFALQNKYGGPVVHIFDSYDIPYLEGMRDCGNGEASVDAGELIELIEKHGQIIVKEEW